MLSLHWDMNMAIIEVADPYSNWDDVLHYWERVVNWTHYGLEANELEREIRSLLVALWSEKDWLIHEYKDQKTLIELYLNNSLHSRVVGDLANIRKHRSLHPRRNARAVETTYAGIIEIGNLKRPLYFVNDGAGRHIEVMPLLRGAIDEFEDLQLALLAGSLASLVSHHTKQQGGEDTPVNTPR